MQYIVSVKGDKRRDFYNYLIRNGYMPIERHISDNYINSIFPFVIEDNNTFWICESITCCACAASRKRIINSEEFKKILNGN